MLIIKTLLEDFADSMKEKDYARLPYPLWRKIAEYKDNKCKVLFQKDECSIINLQIPLPDHTISMNFEIFDGSFGEFLYNNQKKYFYSEENDNSMNLMSKFDFGSCENDNIRMSPYGLACKNASGTWVSYDVTSESVMDVDIFNFAGQRYLYKMPVSVSAIAAGDLIIHNKHPMFVVTVTETGIEVVDVVAAERKVILPIKSPFGFDFYTKVVNLFDSMKPAAADTPFGNMLPFFMLNSTEDSDSILPLFFLMQNGTMDFASNPFLLYTLMSNNKNNDNLLPLMLLMNQTKS